jgi:hypothetical protein
MISLCKTDIAEENLREEERLPSSPVFERGRELL